MRNLTLDPPSNLTFSGIENQGSKCPEEALVPVPPREGSWGSLMIKNRRKK